MIKLAKKEEDRGDITQFRQNPEVDSASLNGANKKPCLIVISGHLIGMELEFSHSSRIVGRGSQADIKLEDNSVSRNHFLLIDRHGACYLSDLGSTNGTFVNGVRVDNPIPLSDGDKINAGNLTFRFSYHDHEDSNYHTQIRQMVIKDGLTDAYNKRYFIDVFEREFQYSKRNNKGLSLIFLDIDHFKSVNDTYGHEAGDFVLSEISKLIIKQERAYDLFARYGGEEFVLLLREDDPAIAEIVAQRIRWEVEQHEFKYANQSIKVTVSLGVTFYNGTNRFELSKQFIQRADELLYKAKQSGRNRVCCDPAPELKPTLVVSKGSE